MLLNFSEPIEEEIDAGSQDPADAGPDSSPNDDMCGDGVMQETETCDDMNRNDLDGCSAACGVEAGYSCAGQPSLCSTLAICPEATIVPVGPALDSCLSYYNAGYRASGRYPIDPDGAALRAAFDVICDMQTAGGGWTVIANNNNLAVEPEGCLARLATVEAFACGTASCSEDFALPAFGMPFTELAWAVHDGSFNIGAHHLFRWATARTLPNQANWTLNAGEFDQKLTGLEGEELIGCVANLNPPTLRRIANENVVAALGGFQITDVVTVFDDDANAATPGNMSFTDVDTAGLDDFQDGNGCGDLWSPLASRGAASLVMIR